MLKKVKDIFKKDEYWRFIHIPKPNLTRKKNKFENTENEFFYHLSNDYYGIEYIDVHNIKFIIQDNKIKNIIEEIYKKNKISIDLYINNSQNRKEVTLKKGTELYKIYEEMFVKKEIKKFYFTSGLVIRNCCNLLIFRKLSKENEEIKKVLLLARYKNPDSFFSKENMPLDIFKILYKMSIHIDIFGYWYKKYSHVRSTIVPWYRYYKMIKTCLGIKLSTGSYFDIPKNKKQII